ncbi:MAG: DUF3943 domain-containing protein [Treponema sp.]|nr:DUF3943 domain-containing protein [Treponema sp.]
MDKKIITLFICITVLFTTAFSQEGTEDDSVQISEDTTIVYAQPDLRHGIIAFGEINLMNILLTGYNRVVRKMDYANVSLESMWYNLSHPWVWDQDEFYINTIGHPYQGAHYYTAGRANGLDFWASLGLTFYGSLTWEYLLETETPSYNDLILTTVSGAMFGEVLHRVYLLLEDDFPYLAWIVSPQAALNRFVLGERSPKENGDLFALYGSVGPSFMLSSIKSEGNNNNLSPFNKQFGGKISVRIVYEDPYAHNTKVPLDCFDIQGDFMISPGHYFIAFSGIEDLFSWQLDLKNDTTFAVTLLYDNIFSTDMNYSNNSLGVSLFRRRNELLWNAHLSAAFIGGSDYYYTFVVDDRSSSIDGSEQRLYDIGIGATAKAEVRYQHPVIGTFFASGVSSLFYTLPHSVPDDGSDGWNFIWTLNFGYEHQIYKGIGAGISCFIYNKHGFYDSADNVDQWHSHFSTYVSYKLK